ncbi:flagellar biosynthesis protein FlhB [Alkalihalophilus pseudofirmus OF4]|uniref:Flagellar biosynthetic protein FlhB n=2 Tax=Alkalihalophilus TaxID=2893060 RepID=D3FT21_ALKPO|nr:MULTISPECIES: flagellar biosynthesis protein FlhB [Alkalihalophilus]ADC48089.1 flagellar biosynthesis protein FlhB [Alkalihalophilus pseudofirmus OF4]ERN53298.1 flagellar biosynthesis protein FlhB [Alkalihalophilus marmarensis DSM 21297]MCM3489565.1 flagellar biosynthesis protein FlhB [Alkalihalophilus marmarensis]MED1602304.1 flagellar biosynthesis protein FlhB [Alkalihalophilus marmarensis]
MAFLRMNLQFFADEKTEKATPKKRQDSRKKGQVAKSTDVNTAIILLLVFLFLWFFGGAIIGSTLMDLMKHVFQTYLLMDVTPRSFEAMFKEIVMEAAVVLLPIMLVAMVAGVAASYIQVGPLFTTDPLKMKLSKIDPIKGFKRIFSVRAIVELLKSLLKIAFAGVVVFVILWFNLEDVLLLSQKAVADGFYVIAQLTALMGVAVAVLLLFLSIPDYLYQKYDHEKQIKMSKKDIKDEHKNMEGDPRIKSKRKQKQMEMAMQRMMQEVPNADVVITNPTHYAIALKYDEEKADAPIIVAKGVDYVAQKIKGIASEHDVVLVENKPLARALYANADIGEQVPEDMFKAVAEVLAYVYRLKNKQVN